MAIQGCGQTSETLTGVQDIPRSSNPPYSTTGYPRDQSSDNTAALHGSCGDHCELCQFLSVAELSESGTISRYKPNENGVISRYKPPVLPQGIFSAFFHEECARCSEFPASEASICSFCTHLRPRHLFFHGLPKYISILKRNSKGFQKVFHILLGELEQLRSRALQCGFCNFLTTRPQFSDSDPSTTIGMTFDKSGVMLFKNGKYVGDLLLDPETAPTPPDRGKVQWDLIKGWLAEHPKQPTTKGTWPGKILDDFRLIDVVRNCVVRVSEPNDYATLSYVWGASTEVQLEARKCTIAILEQEGSLLSADVPTTIYDAIVATKMLGLRYLWVDRICIVQDDENNKLHQISAMDSIYATSHVTLVAVLGRDAMSGLPGVRVDRRKVKYSVHWNGLTVAFPYWPDAGGLGATSRRTSLCKLKYWRWYMFDLDSKWYNRGWTYQEAVVSERLLFFTEEGAFLEVKGNPVLLAEGDTRVSQRQHERHSSPNYYAAVWEILYRKLTYSTDVLLAFQGVLNWVIRNDCYIDKNHRFGIPFEEFDTAIQWQPGDASHKRSPASPQRFPSWSWASMESVVDYGKTVSTCGSLATWAFCEPAANDQLCLVPVTSRPKWYRDSWGVQEGLDVRVLMMIAWLQGCFARPPPFHFTPDSSLSSIQRQIDEQFPTYDDFWRISRGENWQQEMFSQQDLRIASTQPGRVLIHTQCTLLQIQKLKRSSSYFYIKRSNGQRIGVIELSQESQEIVSSIDRQNWGMCIETLALGVYFGTDFILSRANPLKRTSRWTWERKDPGLNDEVFSKEMNYICAMESASDSELERKPPPQVVVMLVHRCGPVARRLGIGHVYLKLWGETEKELKTVILE